MPKNVIFDPKNGLKITKKHGKRFENVLMGQKYIKPGQNGSKWQTPTKKGLKWTKQGQKT